MNVFFQKLKMFWSDPTLRRRFYFTVGALAVFRLLAVVPIPGIDTFQLQQFFSNNQFLGLLNIFSGGGLANLSIVMLGVGPFITATIVMQLLTIMSPRLKQIYQEEGEAGRMKFAQYSRFLTIPLALGQGFAFLVLLENQGVIASTGAASMITNIIIVTAGSMLLTWIGELINEFGIGNGVSLIIFAGIVAALPQTLVQIFVTYDPAQIPTYLAFLVVGLIVTFGIVLITEAERPIPITYAKRVRGSRVYGGISTYLPLRLNQPGVIPIIFALSILLFPQMLVNFLATSSNVIVHTVAGALVAFLNNGWWYAAVYFVLVFVFTYFYTAVTFDPHSVSENLQKSGAFVPGVRPGQSTTTYIADILTRLTLVGALFLGLIAVLPMGMRAITGVASISIGGTSLLIVVSVVVDFIKRIDAQLAAREY